MKKPKRRGGNITDRAVTVFFRRLYYVTRDLSRPVARLNSRLPIAVRLLEERDLEDYLLFRPSTGKNEFFSRISAGHQCHASWYDKRIVDVAWCTTGRGPVPYLGREAILDEGDVFIFDSYTHPDYRGYNLFMAKFSHVFRFSQESGFLRNTGVVAFENTTSLTVLLRLGCEVAGLYSSLGIGRSRIVWSHSATDRLLPEMRLAPLKG